MATHRTSPGNAEKLQQLERMLAELLAQLLRRGFFGNGAIELSVQDGTIQHIRRKVEQVER
jgi:hypothetical protein